MGFLENQKISNIQWVTQSPGVLVWRFPDPDQVLQNNSTVVVGPGQAMLFVNEGRPEGVVTEPGSYDLSTANIPFLTSMLSIFRGLDSKHKGQVYFFNIAEITNVGWGTKSPIKYVDPVYGFPVGLRAFGNYTFKVQDPGKFFTEFVGDREQLTSEDFRDTINGCIILPISNALANAKFGFTEIDSHKLELSDSIEKQVAEEFGVFGFEMKDFRLENTDFDEETQRRVGSIADTQAQAQAINALGNVNTAGMANYAQLQQLEALKSAAANPNGAAAAGVGLGAGVGMGAAMGNTLAQAVAPQPQQPPPVQPGVAGAAATPVVAPLGPPGSVPPAAAEQGPSPPQPQQPQSSG